MKKLITVAALILTFNVQLSTFNAAYAAAIEQVIVRQQWPWSTDVKVEYKLTGVTAPVDLTVKAYNGAVELPLPSAAITGDLYGILEDGIGQLTIDPVAAFGTEKVALANFKVKLQLSDSAANINDSLYRIVDLTNGNVKDVSRADIMNDRATYGAYVTSYSQIRADFTTGLDPAEVFIWTGVTNNPAYKTTKIVLRRIPAKNKTFPYGAANCTLTNDFWVGVFDLTYEQYKTLTGTYGDGTYGYLDDFETMPISGLPYKTYNNTVLPLLNTKAPSILTFDAPTEARLYFAIAGGVYDSAYHGAPDKDPVSWNKDNSGATAQPHPVGTRLPNAYGLYDAIGNMNQVCLDSNSTGTRPAVDTVEPMITGYGNRVALGGPFNYRYPATDYRGGGDGLAYNSGNATIGYRPYADFR